MDPVTSSNWSADRSGGAGSADGSAQLEFAKAHQEAEHARSDGEVSVAVGTKKLPPLNSVKVEFKGKANSKPAPRINLEWGPVTVKTDKKRTEVDVKVLPGVTLGSDGGNPKAAIGIDAKLKVKDGPASSPSDKTEVEVKAKLEGKFRVLDNSDPYSAGTAELKGEAKVKAGPFEFGFKKTLAEFAARFRGASDAIEGNRRRLADEPELGSSYKTDTADRNIKVELQEDSESPRKPGQTSSLKGVWDLIKHAGDPFAIDPDTGEVVHQSADPARYNQLSSPRQD
jgi:hypothetical protein